MPHTTASLLATVLLLGVTGTARGDTSSSPDQRAAALAARMSTDQLLTLVDSRYAVDAKFLGPVNHKPPAALGSAAWTPGIAELGLPPLEESDAGLGVADPTDITGHPVRGVAGASIATPSGLATAATWNPELAFAAGRMIGGEARAEGFNVLLAGGINLVRDARNGRNFEYAGEDPWLAGVIVGNEIRGIQSAHVISTIKHFALNNYETNRFTASADIDWAAARESDLLAFEIGIELGQPGSVMCSYNRVNGEPACGSDMLLNRILKGDWHYPGWVMSDWGAVHALSAANAGIDQESGDYFDIPNGGPFFTDKLRQAVAHGEVSHARLEDMARRIIRSELAVGIGSTAPTIVPIQADADRAVAQSGEEQGAVLLKNDGDVLPLRRGETIAVIGGNAANGVLEGSGSSQVLPVGGPAPPSDRNRAVLHPVIWLPSSPLDALRRGNGDGDAQVSWSDGTSLDQAVAAARAAKVAIVFADQWMTESLDAKSLALPPDAATGADQNRLIAAVAAANPHTIVVIESGGPVAMPWLDKVAGVIEAWYPGAGGGAALARLIFGDVSPSGHLPVTFPASEAQLPRPTIPSGQNVDYRIEGAAVGYKWFRKTGRTPLFAFGHGLSYTRFAVSHLQADARKDGLHLSLDVTNTGARTGQAVPQFYVDLPDGAAPFRLIGFDKIALTPGETRHVALIADPRLLASFDDGQHGWHIASGRSTIRAGFAADDLAVSTPVVLTEARFAP